MGKTEKSVNKSAKIGKVVSTKMEKTAVVIVSNLVKHPVVGKYVKKTTRCMVQDEKNEAKVGDKVKIIGIRPISKNKRWKLESILEAGK